MAVQTAIEYSGRRVRLLEFDGSGRKLRVLAVQDVDLDVKAEPGEEADPDDLRAAAIADAVKEAGFATDPSAMAFDAGHAMFREFDLPFTSEDQIAKVVRFESESHFPGDIDEIVLQHVVLRQTRDKSHLLVAAVRKDDLLDRLDILEESGLDPMFVDIDVFALFTALVGTGVAAEHARVAVVAAQESTASLMFLLEGKLYAVRSIRIGTHGVANVEDGEAAGERERRPAAGGAGAAVAAAAVVAERDLETARTHEYLTRLAREIRRTVSTLPDAGQPDALYVTGSGSSMKGFAEAVGGAFGAKAEPLDLLGKVDHKLSAQDVAAFGPDIGVALGVAFKLNGLDVTNTDFRREEAAYTRKFDQVKTPLIVLSFLAFLTVAFLGLQEYMNVAKVKSEYASMQDLGQRLLADLGADEAIRAQAESAEFGPKRMQALLTAVGDIREAIKQDLGRGTKIPELQSALAVWIEAFNTIKDAEDPIGRLALDRLDIDVASKTPTLKISGEVEDQTHYQVLIDTLKNRPMFKNVQPGAVKQTASGLRFTDIVIDVDMEQAPLEENPTEQPAPADKPADKPADSAADEPAESPAPDAKPAEGG